MSDTAIFDDHAAMSRARDTGVLPREELFPTTTVCELSGASYRQLDYWCRNAVLPAARRARGQGSHRAFTRDQIVVARVLRQLAELGAQRPALTQTARDLLYSRRRWSAFIIVTPDGRVRHVRSLDDLVGGWVVNLRGCELRVDMQLRLAG